MSAKSHTIGEKPNLPTGRFFRMITGHLESGWAAALLLGVAYSQSNSSRGSLLTLERKREKESFRNQVCKLIRRKGSDESYCPAKRERKILPKKKSALTSNFSWD